jgi:hypothetical protein
MSFSVLIAGAGKSHNSAFGFDVEESYLRSWRLRSGFNAGFSGWLQWVNKWILISSYSCYCSIFDREVGYFNTSL